MTTTKTAPRSNTYTGKCTGCGSTVPALCGKLGAKVDGRWTVHHNHCTPTAKATMQRTATRRYAPAPRTCYVCGGASYDCDGRNCTGN